MIAAGKYKARATGQVVLGESSLKGTPFVECYFEVLANAEDPANGEKVRWTGYFSDARNAKGTSGAERTIEALQTCGWEGDDVGVFASGELHGLDTCEVEIVVEHEEYEDKETGEARVSPRVQWVNKLGGYLNIQNAMPAEKAASFGEKMRGLVLKMRSKNPPVEDTSFAFGANAPSSSKKASGAKKGW